ncbi:MAG: hypothetical protein WKF97_20475 [Chitinophagaceae bacterium]
MVTTDISQLTAECNTWRTNLRQYREEFTHSKQSLLEVASRQNAKNTLQEIEHYHNQFHIQLINIHDVKQAIKEHERIASWELKSTSTISDGVWAKHEDLYEKYQSLDHTLKELKEDFSRFLQKNTS